MKQSLHFGLSQNLRMTPQLQQAIRLLQLSSLDLQQEIQEALYTNPLIELEERSEHSEESDAESGADGTTEKVARSDEFDYSAMESMSRNPFSGSEYIERDDAAEESLQDYLNWQLNLAPMSTLDRLIGETIIDSIGPSGELATSIEEIAESIPADDPVEIEDVLCVLHCIQRFDPPGVGFRNLRECLLIQLSLLPETGAVDTAIDLVERHLDALSKLGLEGLARKLKRPIEELDEAYQLIKSLNPRPGYEYSADAADYIVPDLTIFKRSGQWQVALNHYAVPKIKLNETYASMVKEADEQQTKDYLRTHMQEAKWLLRSLESRNDTLLRVGQAIVEHQIEFFEQGEQAMKPLILRDLAEKLELHESTISRATSQKYLASPRGVFELKYFFSSQLATAAGGECSSTAIRALIGNLVKSENPGKPLSDSSLTKLLEKEGIVVARRTIAKYREMLGIPPSSQRKSMINSQ